MASTSSKPVKQYGLTEVYSAPNPQVDIVFVHGLNGNPYKTWTTEKPEVFWPRDLLPKTLKEQSCRILVHGYDANVTAFTDGTSRDHIHHHAEHLVGHLNAKRALDKARDRPIIFVCHSLGGLVVKRCLIYSESIRHQSTEQLRSVYVSTYAIIFLGTPHIGSDLAKWGSMLQAICSAVMPKKLLDTSSQLVKGLEKNNETLQNINRLFLEIVDRFQIYYFHESKPMDLKGTRKFVVEEDSAAPLTRGAMRMGIEQDHSHMCKFEDEDAPGYYVVAEALQRYAAAAPAAIRRRWEEENTLRFVEHQMSIRSALTSGPSQPRLNIDDYSVAPLFRDYPVTSSFNDGRAWFRNDPSPHHLPSTANGMRLIPDATLSTSLPTSIDSSRRIEDIPSPTVTQFPVAPFGFRPNDRFIGFEKELDRLQSKLHDQKRLMMGSCAALVWGPPGCGKTHLVREYVWLHRSEYPAGCFWVDCKSAESRSRGFWDIAQALSISDNHDTQGREKDIADKFVDSVRRWFEQREGWLLVFDGISFDADRDLDIFRYFIPDRPGNNIIFTSTDKTLANRHRLLNAPGVAVGPMAETEACDLLFYSLGLKKPSSTHRQKAAELVKRYYCLPGAIHAAAHVLIAKSRTLDKYVPSTSDQPIAGPFLEILTTLRDHGRVEAINVITLLSFLSHAVPVALIYFGRAALAEFGVELRSVEHEGGMHHELDNSIITLVKYGLVERTLLEYSVASSSEASSPDAVRPASKENVPPFESGQGRTLPHIPSSGSLDRLMKDPEPEDSTQSSTRSSIYTVDILRVHNYLQGIIRDDLKQHQSESARSDWWWLIVASRLLCQSYAVALEKINTSSNLGLVRDFREYETQAAQVWSHYPKSPHKAPPALIQARHDLHQMIRHVQREVSNRSQSASSTGQESRMRTSVFERSGSASDSPNTPRSRLTHASTWSLTRSENEIDNDLTRELGWQDNNYGLSLPHLPASQIALEHSWYAENTHNDDHPRDFRSPTSVSRQSSGSDLTATRPEPTNAPPQAPFSFSSPMFRGRQAAERKRRDLGEWRPLPAPPALSTAGVHATHSRSPSFSGSGYRSSTIPPSGSEAEVVLAAVQRSSPPAPRAAKLVTGSRPVPIQTTSRTDVVDARSPLGVKSPNTRLSPLAQEFISGTSSSSKDSQINSVDTRRASTPGLADAVPNSNPAARGSRPNSALSTSETASRAPRSSFWQSYIRNSGTGTGFQRVMGNLRIPSGWTSAPMSRDTSRDSHVSVATAPPIAPQRTSPRTDIQAGKAEPGGRPLPRSIEVSDVDFDQLGEWSTSELAAPATPTGSRRSLLTE